ncbi:Repressor protein c2 [Pseudomonas syringae pv. cilantro]|uniref:Repressor protein c2 n=1 Tax=Pseudomonas syringae pv. cilantro TaxID=81035 RepID=A0A0N0GFU3_PSESX|nr:Repressor protein c2 [Pseudomonas syringae pv. cilantro]KPW78148.1 Repressor protein c2 [Pseudomonas syringae pv. coriandricola]
MAFLEFLVAAARARIVAANVLQGVAYRFLVSVTAVWTVDMAMLVVVMIVVAIGAMNMGLLVHRCTPVESVIDLARIIPQIATQQ